MISLRGALIWSGVAVAALVPIAVASASPLLAWRGPVYIAGGFAGIVALSLLLLQPLLIGGVFPGLSARSSRAAHRTVGAVLVIAVAAHVAGLWITSAPDVIDALLFVSPTPFSVWGVIAMWAAFAAGLMALLRRRLRLSPRLWRIAHVLLSAIVVVGSVVHALLIEGAMETTTKAALCILVSAAAVGVIADLRLLRRPSFSQLRRD